MSKASLIVSFIAASVVLIGAGLCLTHRKVVAPSTPDVSQAKGLRYLPLGDSYTIGQSVEPSQRWPNQLSQRLSAAGTANTIVANPAVTGYTTQDLIDRELPLVQKLQPDFVTIQIGVNDYVQGVPAATFQANFIKILNEVQQNLADPHKIVLVTIPDYILTPTGKLYGDPVTASADITKFNDFVKQTGAARDLPVADIFPASQQVTSDPSLTADDGLHPSGKQYQIWTGVIYPLAVKVLGQKP